MWQVLTAIGTLIAESFKKYQERKQAEHQVIIAQEKARKELAMAVIEKELELGQTQIKATGRGFKYLTFAIWFGPFLISTIFPSVGAQIFANLKELPEWYVQSCMVIMFAIWGIQVGKDSIATIFQGLGQFFKERQRLTFNRKLFYDTVRSVDGNISQYEVELFEKAINKALEK